MLKEEINKKFISTIEGLQKLSTEIILRSNQLIAIINEITKSKLVFIKSQIDCCNIALKNNENNIKKKFKDYENFYFQQANFDNFEKITEQNFLIFKKSEEISESTFSTISNIKSTISYSENLFQMNINEMELKKKEREEEEIEKKKREEEIVKKKREEEIEKKKREEEIEKKKREEEIEKKKREEEIVKKKREEEIEKKKREEEIEKKKREEEIEKKKREEEIEKKKREEEIEKKKREEEEIEKKKREEEIREKEREEEELKIINEGLDKRNVEQVRLVKRLIENGIALSVKVQVVLESIDRKYFVPADGSPYEDKPQRIGFNTTISAPHMHAYTLVWLEKYLTPGICILDVGSGSGYLTLCLAKMIGRGKVFGIDHIEKLTTQALKNIAMSQSELSNDPQLLIQMSHKDGRNGLPEFAPFNVIHVGASTTKIPEPLIDQLAPGGVLIAPVGPDSASQKITLVEKDLNGSLRYSALLNVCYAPLTDKKTQCP